MTTTETTLSAPGTLRGRRGPSFGERLRRSWGRWWFAYAMLTPVFVVMGVLIFYPLVKGVYYSFTDANQFNALNPLQKSTYKWTGLANYKQILQSEEFRSVLGFTAVWTFVNVFFHFTLGLGLALALNRTLKFRGFYRLLLLVPWAVPSFISAFAWRFMFNNPYGFIDQFLMKLGVHTPPAFLGDPTWAKVAVITTNVWLGVPFMMVALLGGLQAIDADLLDAAAADGANAWQRFWTVTMPGLRPVAATVVLLGLIWTFNMFNIIYLVTGGGPGSATQILATYAYQNAFAFRLYGTATAYGVIILSILLVFSQFYRWSVAKLGEETWS